MANEVRKTFHLAFLLLNVALVVIAQCTGTQFITGACKSDADCASGCCGFNSGKCAGAIVALERDGGCGFGDAQPNDNAASKLSGQTSASPTTLISVVKAAATGSNGAENGAGKQFITGACATDKDCASGCCGFKSGKCAGAIIAQERDGGCGFGDAQPNDNAASILRGQVPTTSTPAPAIPSTIAAQQAASTVQAAAANSNGAGNKAAKQFITGACTSDADCASGCCDFKSGKCAGAIIAQERDGGCGFGDAAPNDNAAKKLTGRVDGVELYAKSS